MNIFVGNLNFQTEENQLHDLFAEFGAVSSARIMIDKFSRRSRGFGFVEMADKDAAERAIDKLNGSYFDQKTIVVNEARPREERSNSGYGNRGGSGYNNRRY